MKTKTNTLKTGVVAGLCALSLMAGGVGVAATTPATASACETVELEATASTQAIAMYRLYNPNSGEHFYTSNTGERDNCVRCGWIYEGTGWYAPKSGDEVYRLYNPNAGDHHYTLSIKERDWLKSLGWVYEGVGWYSDTAKSVPLYRQYNPNATAGSHNFSTAKSENDWLTTQGWVAEGIAWYGVDTSKTDADTDKKDDTTKDDSSDTPTHTHNWQPVYTTVHHDAVTETVEEPVYETVTTSQIYCQEHKTPILNITKEEKEAIPGRLGYCSSDPKCLASTTRVYHTEKVQAGTQTITKVIKEAYDEKVATGKYTCSCGATK